MSQHDPSMTLKYSLYLKNSCLLVSFGGMMAAPWIESLERAQKEVQDSSGFRFAIFDFSTVYSVTLDAVPILVSLQREMRKREVELRICGLSQALKEKLLKLGVLRQSELSADLQEAVKSIARGDKILAMASSPIEKKAA